MTVLWGIQNATSCVNTTSKVLSLIDDLPQTTLHRSSMTPISLILGVRSRPTISVSNSPGTAAPLLWRTARKLMLHGTEEATGSGAAIA